LKNLVYNVHQNFLILAKIVLSLITRGANQTSYHAKLDQELGKKLLKKVTTHEEAITMLGVYSTAQENILRNICRSNQNKQMFKVI